MSRFFGWDDGKLYADILFESINPKEKVVSFNTDKESEMELVTDEGKRYRNISGQSLSTGWKYLLYETDEPVNGRVELKSLYIEKSVNTSIKLDMPKVGETITLNRKIVVEGIEILIESIRVYTEALDENGNVLYKLPDNNAAIDVKCRITEGIQNGRIADDKSHIRGEIRINNLKSSSKGFSWGPQGLSINGHFNAEDLKDASEVTLVIDAVTLTAEGNWEIPINID
jgi:hypothetical protein